LKEIKMTDVNKEHKKAKFDIANLLGWFECELAKETNAGSPLNARRDLIHALAAFSGVSEVEIVYSLAELANDDEDIK